MNLPLRCHLTQRKARFSSYVGHFRNLTLSVDCFRCEFIVNGTAKRRGEVLSPRHTIAPNTTCWYRFHGLPTDKIWLYFDSYTVFQNPNCTTRLRVTILIFFLCITYPTTLTPNGRTGPTNVRIDTVWEMIMKLDFVLFLSLCSETCFGFHF